MNNKISRTYYGIQLTGKSTNNTVSNNTAGQTTYSDFACYGNSALNAGNGGINFGTTKIGCKWLAAIQKISPTPQC
ncbi:MAG: hypothetical protein ACHQK8_08595, partial [Bacteroidia bacterium]